LKTILPISSNRNNENQLCLHKHRISEIAEMYQTPCYIYDADTVYHQIDELKEVLGREYLGESEITYAAKAYFSEGFAQIISNLGIGVDLVSLFEMKIANKAGIKPEKIHLHGNNKSDEELRYAIEWGISVIVVDSLEELQFLEDLSNEYKKRISIWFRISPDIETKTHKHVQTGQKSSKFGISIYDGQIEQSFRIVRKSQFLELEGIHAHIGSQLFDPEVYKKVIDVIGEVCKRNGYKPRVISAGGGWGVVYKKNQIENSCENWIKAISQATKDLAHELDFKLPKLVVEPGRWLVARAGLAVYKVGFCKYTGNGDYIVAVDGGIADNPRPALYDAEYEVVLCDREINESQGQNATLVGRFCESGDRIIQNAILPEMNRGEIIAIPVSGAYQLSMASNYNLAVRPAVLWVEKEKVSILQQRESFDKYFYWQSSG
jgi:diaminopimelate decarboxylase